MVSIVGDELGRHRCNLRIKVPSFVSKRYRVADPYPYPVSIGSVDPDPYSESGSRRAKMTKT